MAPKRTQRTVPTQSKGLPPFVLPLAGGLVFIVACVLIWYFVIKKKDGDDTDGGVGGNGSSKQEFCEVRLECVTSSSPPGTPTPSENISNETLASFKAALLANSAFRALTTAESTVLDVLVQQQKDAYVAAGADVQVDILVLKNGADYRAATSEVLASYTGFGNKVLQIFPVTLALSADAGLIGNEDFAYLIQVIPPPDDSLFRTIVPAGEEQENTSFISKSAFEGNTCPPSTCR